MCAHFWTQIQIKKSIKKQNKILRLIRSLEKNSLAKKGLNPKRFKINKIKLKLIFCFGINNI